MLRWEGSQHGYVGPRMSKSDRRKHRLLGLYVCPLIGCSDHHPKYCWRCFAFPSQRQIPMWTFCGFWLSHDCSVCRKRMYFTRNWAHFPECYLEMLRMSRNRMGQHGGLV